MNFCTHKKYNTVSGCDETCPKTNTNSELEQKIQSVLSEAYDRNDLGENWAVSELISLFHLTKEKLLLSQKEEMVEMIENYQVDLCENSQEFKKFVISLIQSK